MRCPYCLKKINKKNKSKDHIISKGLFPKNTNFTGFTLYCCQNCNNDFSLIEDIIKFLFTTDYYSMEYIKSYELFDMDSIDKTIQSIFKKIVIKYNGDIFLPNRNSKFLLDRAMSLYIKPYYDKLDIYGEKILRGLVYKHFKKYIHNKHKCITKLLTLSEFSVLSSNKQNDIRKSLKYFQSIKLNTINNIPQELISYKISILKDYNNEYCLMLTIYNSIILIVFPNCIRLENNKKDNK